jgi:hypothetical protein
MSLPPLPRPVKLFFLADILIGLPYIANQMAGEPFTKINRFVNMDYEANLPSWYSSMQWATAAALMGFVAWRLYRRRAADWVLLGLIAAVFITLSLDEASTMHEKLTAGMSDKAGIEGAENHVLWLPALGLPVMAGLAFIARRAKATFGANPGALATLLIGLTIFALGAFLVEPSARITFHRVAVGFVWLEETMEMLGVTFLVWSGFALAVQEGLLAFEGVPPAVTRSGGS